MNNGDTIILPITGADVVLYNGQCYYKTDQRGIPNVSLSDVSEVFADCNTCVDSLIPVTPTPTSTPPVTVTPTPTATMPMIPVTPSSTPDVTPTSTPAGTPAGTPASTPTATPTPTATTPFTSINFNDYVVVELCPGQGATLGETIIVQHRHSETINLNVTDIPKINAECL